MRDWCLISEVVAGARVVSSGSIVLNTGLHTRDTGLTVGCLLPGCPVVGEEASKVVEIFPASGMLVTWIASAVFMVACLAVAGDDSPQPGSDGLVERVLDGTGEASVMTKGPETIVDFVPGNFVNEDLRTGFLSLSTVVVDFCTTGCLSSRSCSGLSLSVSGFELLGISWMDCSTRWLCLVWMANLGVVALVVLVTLLTALVVLGTPLTALVVLDTPLTDGRDVSKTVFLGLMTGSLVDTVIRKTGFFGLTSGWFSTRSRPSPGIGVELLRIALLKLLTGCQVVVGSVLGVVKGLPGHLNQLHLRKKYCDMTVVVLLGLGDVVL